MALSNLLSKSSGHRGVGSSNDSLTSILVTGASLIITTELAERILRECRYRHQRIINQDRALGLGEKIENRTLPENEQIAFALFRGVLILLNGYHRLTAVTLAEIGHRFRIEIYPCNSEEEIDALYCRFDQGGNTRTVTQISRSLGLHDETGGLSPAGAALLLRATPLLMLELKRVAPSKRPRETKDVDRRKEYALKWKPQAVLYQGFLAGNTVAKTAAFRYSGTFAVALVTLKHQPERASEFWSEAIRNSGLVGDDARKTLHEAFLERKYLRREEFDFIEMASRAWNAFYSKRPLKLVKAFGTCRQVRLLGTPIMGGE